MTSFSQIPSIDHFVIKQESTMGDPCDPIVIQWKFELKHSSWSVVQIGKYHKESGRHPKRTTFSLPTDLIEKFLRKIGSIDIPLFLPFDMGCDGAFTELEYGGYFGGLKLRWWSCPPKELEKLDRAVTSLLEGIQ